MERMHESLPYRISDRKELLQLDKVATLLGASYWAAERNRQTIEASISESLCFGLYRGEEQAGFARAVTDRATFSWICDVIIDPNHRGQGLGKWLVGTVLEHPDIRHTNKMLATKDAHSLYERYGFVRTEAMRLPRRAR